MTDRQKYNIKIIAILNFLIQKYPDLRFNQLLIDSGVLEVEECLCQGDREQVIRDSFYEEPEITWNRMLKSDVVKNISEI